MSSWNTMHKDIYIYITYLAQLNPSGPSYKWPDPKNPTHLLNQQTPTLQRLRLASLRIRLAAPGALGFLSCSLDNKHIWDTYGIWYIKYVCSDHNISQHIVLWKIPWLFCVLPMFWLQLSIIRKEQRGQIHYPGFNLMTYMIQYYNYVMYVYICIYIYVYIYMYIYMYIYIYSFWECYSMWGYPQNAFKQVR